MPMLILVMMSALTWASLIDDVTISHRAPPTSLTIAAKLSERTEELLNRLHQPVSQRAAGTVSIQLSRLAIFTLNRISIHVLLLFYPSVVSLRFGLHDCAVDFGFSH